MILFEDTTQFTAACVGDLHQLQLALSGCSPHIINAVDETGWTVLHWCAAGGHTACIRWLTSEMGADILARNKNGAIPLHLAAANGYLGAVAALLDAGSVGAIDMELYGSQFELTAGDTPLHCAIYNYHRLVAFLLIDRGAKVANVHLDDRRLTSIPDWIHQFVESRAHCRSIAILIMGIHKHGQSNVAFRFDKHVVRMISQHIWSSRMEDD
jgi:ankyrin repeat protein